ncbi:hypothetical protein COO59_10675 [Mixta theicola]|uniref:Uncharacterized protein n=1 Tax=Mixta theicola TaxID=1458355 RepID=A0A2K1Q918_9GAMM|nr:hypothetical protein [Mixta theicola]PNS11487.1 hypothetical protein COO59_10675 [Mixta theicola]GLR08565.1 hypothetical protein GCM10007905_12840 [Mixta theicola]
MFLSFLTRLLITTVVTGSYAVAADLPDINGAILTPPAEQFSMLPTASAAETRAEAPAAQPPESGSDEVTSPETGTDAVAPPSALPAPAESEEVKQDAVIRAALQAIRQHQLTPLATDCLSMSFVDNSDDPENYLIDVRENRNSPACGGDPETAPHLFFLKASKADGALQTDAGVEPDDFYPLENSEQPDVAALTAEDFSVQVNGVTLTLGQVWNEDVMMSLPPERAQQQDKPNAKSAWRYFQHRYDALTLTASNENWQQKQHSPDDNYLGEITLVNPTLATHRGVHVGMTPDEVERRYGPGEADERNGESWLSWQQDDNVLSVRISNGLVTLIRLSNLQPDRDAAE